MKRIEQRVTNLEKQINPNCRTIIFQQFYSDHDWNPKEALKSDNVISRWYNVEITGGTPEQRKRKLAELRADPKYQRPSWDKEIELTENTNNQR